MSISSTSSQQCINCYPDEERENLTRVNIGSQKASYPIMEEKEFCNSKSLSYPMKKLRSDSPLNNLYNPHTTSLRILHTYKKMLRSRPLTVSTNTLDFLVVAFIFPDCVVQVAVVPEVNPGY